MFDMESDLISVWVNVNLIHLRRGANRWVCDFVQSDDFVWLFLASFVSTQNPIDSLIPLEIIVHHRKD